MTDLSNLEAEQALLGCLMVWNHQLQSAKGLSGENFYEPVHGRIFDAIKTMVMEGRVANPLTLSEYLPNDEALELLGGGKYLMQLAKKAGLVVDIRDYSWIIIDLYQRREIISAFQCAVESAGKPDIENPVDGIISKARQILDGIESKKPFNGESNRQVGRKIVDDLTIHYDVISTGYPRLDDAMDGGLYSGKTYGFGGRKKTGKTILASSISFQLNQAGVKHLFICGEMSPKEIEQRNIARGTSEFPSAFRLRRSDPNFQKKVAQFVHDNPDNVVYFNAPGLTFAKLKEIVFRATADKSIKGIILDYWQLVGGKESRKSTAEHLDEVAQWIADFGRQSGLWSIIMAQINQEGNTRGGEGLRLACDQFYQIQRDDITQPPMWLEMMETRYTKWQNVGEASKPGLIPRAGYTLIETGPWYREEP